MKVVFGIAIAGDGYLATVWWSCWAAAFLRGWSAFPLWFTGLVLCLAIAALGTSISMSPPAAQSEGGAGHE